MNVKDAIGPLAQALIVALDNGDDARSAFMALKNHLVLAGFSEDDAQIATRQTPCYLATRDHFENESLPMIELEGPTVIAGKAMFVQKNTRPCAQAVAVDDSAVEAAIRELSREFCPNHPETHIGTFRRAFNRFKALQAALSPIAGVTHGTNEGWGDE